MKYYQVKIYTSHEGIEPLSAVLLENGFDSIVVDDPADAFDILNKKEDYEWDYIDPSVFANKDKEPTITIYFEDTKISALHIRELTKLIEMVKGCVKGGMYGPEADFGRLEVETIIVNDDDWKDKWKEFFKPSKITDTLVVKPTWEEYEPAEGEKIIEIDPGMAFGTGTHETTTLCMRLLEKYLKDDQSVMDVGCGSGILAIAAALLGSKDILGVEIDPDAVRTAIENVELNGVSDVVEVKEGDLTKGVNKVVDLIVANLMAPLVIELSGAAADHLVDKGIYISSGILIEKRDQVAEAVKAAGFEIVEILEEGEWCAIAAQKM
ncbi:MAG: 50S ribosomal protein L11 methyltransferase [Firmicutes bacterium]|nr:50S ribosomal protein L11 methyltransferase [Bacillota bacterium]